MPAHDSTSKEHKVTARSKADEPAQDVDVPLPTSEIGHHPNTKVSPNTIVQLQRTIGNKAVRRLFRDTTAHIQRNGNGSGTPTEPSTPTIDKLPDIMAGWPHDFDTLKSSYPVATAVLALYTDVPGRLTEKLRQCVVLHANAGRIRGLLAQAADEERLAWLNKIQDSKSKLGLSAGTIFQGDDGDLMAQMPDYAVDFFQRVMNTAAAKWDTLSSENKADFAEKVFNQEKGYDWAVLDVERWVPASKRADLGKALSDALNGPSNMDPFSLKNVHVDKVGDLLTSGFDSYDIDDIANYCYSTLGNSLGKFQGLQGPIKDNEEGIKGALQKFVTAEQAKAIFDALHKVAGEYG